MNTNEYLENRLFDQIEWYDNKSMFCQKRYKVIRLIEIILAALIPIISVIQIGDTLQGGFDIDLFLKLLVAGLGAAILVLAGISGLNKYQELWISYRSTAETLKHHKFLFETNCRPYDKEDRLKRLVENIEGIISREHSNWSSMLEEVSK